MIKNGIGVFSQGGAYVAAKITIGAAETFTFSNIVSSGMAENLMVDWGDGNSDTYVPGSYNPGGTPIQHTYANAGDYNIKFTGGDFGNITTLNIFNNSYVKIINVSGVFAYSGVSIVDINFYSNPNLTSVIFPVLSGKTYRIIRLHDCALTSLDFRGATYSAPSGGYNFELYNNPALTEVLNLTIESTGVFKVYNTSLDKNWAFDTITTYHNNGIYWYDCGMSQANQNANVNAIYAIRAQLKDTAFVDELTIIGIVTPNATPSGTYDGTTDWAAGAPTSPMAKIYDLENNVTGTYNFNFTDIP